MRNSLKWLATPQEMTFKKIARHTQAPSTTAFRVSVERVGVSGLGGFGAWSLGFGVWGLGFEILGLGFGVWVLGFGGDQNVLGFGILGAGFGIWGFGVWGTPDQRDPLRDSLD